MKPQPRYVPLALSDASKAARSPDLFQGMEAVIKQRQDDELKQRLKTPVMFPQND